MRALLSRLLEVERDADELGEFFWRAARFARGEEREEIEKRAVEYRILADAIRGLIEGCKKEVRK